MCYVLLQILSWHVQNDSKKTARGQQMWSNPIGHLTRHMIRPNSLSVADAKAIMNGDVEKKPRLFKGVIPNVLY
jgi:hypothetical protein